MKLRIRLGKFLLSVAALFWASCSDDAQPLYGTIGIDDSAPESSESLEPISSTAIEEASSSSEATSSETPASSSSANSSSSEEAASSSSSSAKYRLASDTSVTCKDSTFAYNECVYIGGSSAETCSSPEYELRNNATLTIEELIKIEDRLENCADAAPVYGVPSCMNQMRWNTKYYCSNGNIYSHGKNGLVYTNDEYNDLFVSSSSVAESSSSAAPSPLCQKTDFVNKSEVRQDCISEKLDSLAAAGETVSNDLKKCVNTTVDYDYTGEFAKTQICDGDTTVNPRYQAKLDSIREEVDKAIKTCSFPPVPTDTTKTPADSTEP